MVQRIRALSLFSGGLDSILASRVVAAQGIEVIGIKFVSPFFGYDILWDVAAYQERMKALYGLEVVVVDITASYLDILHHPRYGFGKNFNPCVDCKVLMMQKAYAMLAEYGASFLISGEVLGQRPMSQRRDTLNVIERDSGTRDYLVRPLSAKLLTPTRAEREGLLDRELLLSFSGRGRSSQLELARQFGITEFPAPAGGCTLTDVNLSKRIAALYAGDFILSPEEMDGRDVCCMLFGRQFLFPQKSGWLVMGRDLKDNEQLLRLRGEEDILFAVHGHPGPLALLRRGLRIMGTDATARDKTCALAAALVVRYAKKVDGQCLPQQVRIEWPGHAECRTWEPFPDDAYKEWMF